MKCFIPIATGKKIPARVLSSIDSQQGIFLEKIIVDTPGELNSQRNFSRKRIEGEARSRNEINKNLISMDDNDLVLCIDSDIVILNDFSVLLMYNFMRVFKEYGAIALNWFSGKDDIKYSHVRLMAVMYRVGVLKKIYFNPDNAGCFCLSVKKHINDQGLKFDYIDSVKRIGEIIDGKIN